MSLALQLKLLALVLLHGESQLICFRSLGGSDISSFLSLFLKLSSYHPFMLKNNGLLGLPLLLRELPLILKARRLLLLRLDFRLACCLALLELDQAIDLSLLPGNLFLQSFIGFLFSHLQFLQS